MSHCTTTTFDRINELYAEERQLLDRWDLTAEERARFRALHAELEQLWPKRRAEIVFELHGAPRLISSPEPLDKRRRTAFGIAPLPMSGGD